MTLSPIRLTDLAHGGGCGCKLAPQVLQELLADQPKMALYADLLVGTETSDDAAVWQIDDKICILATTDFFMPMVDDPDHFGRIAATNALSDIYAMGGKPIMALAILGMPLDKLPVAAVRAILQGGAAVCAEAGIPIAGGHSIDAPEPIYGLAVIGLAGPTQIRRNSGAKAGDRLILTKGLGVGIYAAAFKKRLLSAEAYAELITSATLLNRIGSTLGETADLHAMTDVTGFGLLGHGLEMARASDLTLVIDYASLPWLKDAESLARSGLATGASGRNWSSYGDDITLPDDFPLWRRTLLTDPQTSGGLLLSCAPRGAEEICAAIRAAGYPAASIIGQTVAGPASVKIVA